MGAQESNKKPKHEMPVFEERMRILQGDMDNTAFANKIGVTRQSIGNWISGYKVPDMRMVIQIATKCNVSVDWLLGLSDVDVKTNEPNIREICNYTGLTEKAAKLLNVVTYKKHDEWMKEDIFEEVKKMPSNILTNSYIAKLMAYYTEIVEQKRVLQNLMDEEYDEYRSFYFTEIEDRAYGISYTRYKIFKDNLNKMKLDLLEIKDIFEKEIRSILDLDEILNKAEDRLGELRTEKSEDSYKKQILFVMASGELMDGTNEASITKKYEIIADLKKLMIEGTDEDASKDK